MSDLFDQSKVLHWMKIAMKPVQILHLIISQDQIENLKRIDEVALDGFRTNLMLTLQITIV